MIQSWILYCLGIIWFWKTMWFKLVQGRRIHYKVVRDSPNNKDWDIQVVDLICVNSWLSQKGDGFNMLWGEEIQSKVILQPQNLVIYTTGRHFNMRTAWTFIVPTRGISERSNLLRICDYESTCPYVSAAEIFTLESASPLMNLMTF